MLKRNGTQTEGNELFYLTHNLFIKLVGFYPEEKTDESLSYFCNEIEMYCECVLYKDFDYDSDAMKVSLNVAYIARDLALLIMDLRTYADLSAYKISKIILPVIYHLIAMLMPLFEEDDIYRAGYNEEVYKILAKKGGDNQTQE